MNGRTPKSMDSASRRRKYVRSHKARSLSTDTVVYEIAHICDECSRRAWADLQAENEFLPGSEAERWSPPAIEREWIMKTWYALCRVLAQDLENGATTIALRPLGILSLAEPRPRAAVPTKQRYRVDADFKFSQSWLTAHKLSVAPGQVIATGLTHGAGAQRGPIYVVQESRLAKYVNLPERAIRLIMAVLLQGISDLLESGLKCSIDFFPIAAKIEADKRVVSWVPITQIPGLARSLSVQSSLNRLERARKLCGENSASMGQFLPRISLSRPLSPLSMSFISNAPSLNDFPDFNTDSGPSGSRTPLSGRLFQGPFQNTLKFSRISPSRWNSSPKIAVAFTPEELSSPEAVDIPESPEPVSRVPVEGKLNEFLCAMDKPRVQSELSSFCVLYQ